MKPVKNHRFCAFLALTLTLLIISSDVFAKADTSVPYDSYNYDYRENIVFTPSPYVPDGSISGLKLGIGAFNSPQDVCVADDGRVYVADTMNNRIVVIDPTLSRCIEIIDSFETDDGSAGTFNKPYGIAISNTNELYVADSQNKRIVILSAPAAPADSTDVTKNERTYIGSISNPKSEVLADDFDFVPLKVTVDYAGRVYVVADNMFEGIMVFENGAFTGFFGTINVTITVWEKIWRKLSTKTQRSKQQLFIPTEFTGIDVDDAGFIYASNIDENGIQAIRRLNPKGQDVIRKGENLNVGGDLRYNNSWDAGDYNGPSEIVDVVVRDNGIYSLLDKKRGRVFTYDSEGNLLYIFGGLGSQIGTFSVPSAIECIGDKLMVLDSYRGELILFSETEYGNLINEAVGLRYDGDETQAVPLWERVLELDENNELANVGIGKAYLTSGDNKAAMKYLKLGMSRRYYSIAFKRYRDEILKKWLAPVLSGLIILIFVLTVFKAIRKKRRNKKLYAKGEGGAQEDE
jgi:DNA-binding beta-propeller fold protein YncE